MKSWVYALIAGLAALAVVAGVGGYMLGMSAGTARANASRSAFLAQRVGGQGGNAAAPGTWPGAGSAGGTGNGAPVTMGTVKSVEGNTLVVTARNGEVKVQLGDSTTVQKPAAGTLQDIQPGQRITVAGQADSSGTVKATSVQLIEAGR